MLARWFDRITDRLARRPGGALSRAIYRHAAGHQPGFRAALEALPTGPGDRVLDVGCGGGAFLARVLASGAAAAGLDHSPDMRATTRELNAEALAAGRLEVAEGDAAQLPFPDAAFTHVFCLNAFFFFPEPGAAVREMARVVRPGGAVAILTTPPAMEPLSRWLFGPIARRMRFDPPGQLDRWNREAGLVVQEMRASPGGSILCLARKPAA